MRRKNSAKPLLGIVALAAVLLAVVAAVPFFVDRKDEGEAGTVLTADQFFGTWQAEKDEGFIITIWRDEDGVIYVNMDREVREDCMEFWECTAEFDEKKAQLSYEDASKVTTTYTGNNGQDQEDYTGGRGSFTLREGQLYWEDAQEDAGSGQVFHWLGEY